MKHCYLLALLLALSLQNICAQSDDCDTISTFPWTERFTDTTHRCWLFIDNDNNGNNWRITDFHPYSGQYSLTARFSLTLEDNWAISPAIQLPDNGCSLLLTWQIYAHPDYEETYDVFVSTSERDDLDAFDSVYSETVSGGYYERNLTLPQYSGQTIYIAFRYRSTFQNFMCIDDFCVNTTAEPIYPPVVNIDSPNSAKTDELVIFNAESDDAEEFYWEIEGAVTTSATGQSFATSWPSPGRYNVSVTATKQFLSTTVSKKITIINGNGTDGISSAVYEPIIYPNPAHNTVTIDDLQTISYELFTPQGCKLKAGAADTPESKIEIDLSPYSDGLYLLRTISRQGVVKVYKIMKL